MFHCIGRVVIVIMFRRVGVSCDDRDGVSVDARVVVLVVTSPKKRKSGDSEILEHISAGLT